MGQAKIRGTFAQRQAEAIERNKEIEKLRRAYESTRRKVSDKVSVTTTAMFGIAIGAMSGRILK